jgi:hypothetical protein
MRLAPFFFFTRSKTCARNEVRSSAAAWDAALLEMPDSVLFILDLLSGSS